MIEARDGFMQAFAFGRADKARPITLPPAVPFGITDCYIKPYACCRHIQPAVEALIGLLNDEKIATDDIKHVEVETYASPPSTPQTGWDDFASAQLSFPYLIGARAALPRHQVRALRRRDAAAIRPSPQFAAQAHASRRRPRSTGSIRSCARRA